MSYSLIESLIIIIKTTLSDVSNDTLTDPLIMLASRGTPYLFLFYIVLNCCFPLDDEP